MLGGDTHDKKYISYVFKNLVYLVSEYVNNELILVHLAINSKTHRYSLLMTALSIFLMCSRISKICTTS